MIYWIIYLVGVLFAIALYVFIQYNAKKTIYLGELLMIIFFSSFSWLFFIVVAIEYGSGVIIFNFENNDRKTKMRE